MATIYLASPYGFSESTIEFSEKLKRLLAKAGHTVIDPWELSKGLIERTMPKANRENLVKKTEILHEMNFQIGEANRAAIEKADLVVAALDGADVDSGTASEIGYSFARGKRIVGYRGDFRLTGENTGAVVNLQVQYWIEKSGGRIARNVPELLGALEMLQTPEKPKEELDKARVERDVWSLETEIQTIRGAVHTRIPGLRQDAFAIAKWEKRQSKSVFWRVGHALGLIPEPKSPDKPPDDDKDMPDLRPQETIDDWTKEVEKWAKELQQKTENATLEPKLDAVDILRITTRAGRLLGATEQLYCAYRELNTPSGMAILSRIMTVVATARDQADAADGHIKNFKAKVGMTEVWRLVLLVQVPATLIYVLFHPNWGLFQVLPATAAVYWEIIYWSIFGAMALSFVTISEVTFSESFDPRHPFKYFYRIPVAPLFATVIIMLVSVVGLDFSPTGTGGTGAKLSVDLTSPNIFLIIGLAFLLGFFSKRALELLDLAWRRLFPSTRSTADNQTTESP